MKTLFVDFDGTICHDHFWRSLPANENKQIQDFLFNGNNTYVVDWMKGVYTSQEINKLAAKETGLAYEFLWQTFVVDCKNMYVQKEILEILLILRNKYYIVLITGNMDCFSRFTVPSLKLKDYFNVIVNSCDEKQLKTDNNGYSFTKYCKGNIIDSVLIEDSEKSCEIFKSLGGKAYKVNHKNDTLRYLNDLQ